MIYYDKETVVENLRAIIETILYTIDLYINVDMILNKKTIARDIEILKSIFGDELESLEIDILKFLRIRLVNSGKFSFLEPLANDAYKLFLVFFYNFTTSIYPIYSTSLNGLKKVIDEVFDVLIELNKKNKYPTKMFVWREDLPRDIKKNMLIEIGVEPSDKIIKALDVGYVVYSKKAISIFYLVTLVFPIAKVRDTHVLELCRVLLKLEFIRRLWYNFVESRKSEIFKKILADFKVQTKIIEWLYPNLKEAG